MASKIKHNWRLSRSEAADLLRNVAETLEDGSDEVAHFGIGLAELVKFKIKIDLSETDTLEVKFSGKGAKVCGPEEVCGAGVVCERYSCLKKRMQVYFKAMRDSAAQGQLPSREIVSVFLSDSELMVSYHGYGDEYYPAYMALCQRLRDAFDREDLEETSDVINALALAKKECHDRYK